MKKKYFVLAAIFAALLAMGWGIRAYRHARLPTVEHGERANEYYCPMHPSYTSDRPGDCPICNMKLVPREKGGKKNEMPVPGQATTVIPESGRQLIGMKSEVLKKRALVSTVRASGRVAYDPDLYNALSEYLEAARARAKVKDSPWPDVHERADALVRSSALRLLQMGLSDAQIEEAGRSEQPPTNLILGGGGGAVWVYAQIYEYEIGMIRPGQAAEITSPAFSGRRLWGVVKAIDPILSAETRSLKVRIEVPNPENLLKLEMFVNAVIQVDLGEKLALPESALMDTGERQLVFVDLSDGRIEPREVRIGREAGGYYELLSGVSEGERVVTSANFLIDSESKLKSAFPKEGAPKQEHRH